ncbi:cyclic GMP-AMP synthase [Platichthys flesus]|uniref:cyclic GMP-AMP synthase n=1 Tax=Platichthys flesus TaxID=8260 RepID=UPI002DB9B764|nr:cyclic GMP-AMP synthase [Platichthys flesus]
MTGRGKPCKAATPKTGCATGKTTTGEYQENGFTKEKHNATTTEQKPKGRSQKTPNRTKEKSSERSSQKKKTKTFTEEMNKLPTDDTTAPSRGAGARTAAGKSKEKSVVEQTKPQPETTKDTTQDSATAAKPKKRPGTAKSEGKTKTTKAEDTIKTSIDSPKPKKCPGTAKLEEKTKTTKPEDTTKTSIKSPKPKTWATVDSLLSTTLGKLKIKRIEKSNTAIVVNKLIDNIIKHLKENTNCFTTAEPLRTGSYYEHVKISKPDEFDIMLSMDVDRVDIKPFGDKGAFYIVALKRGNNPLKKFQDGDMLSAGEMLTEFRDEVKKCAKAFPEWKVDRKRPGCPAVTLTTTVQSVVVSLDVVLSIKVKTRWPDFTQHGFQIDKWLGTKVKQDYKRQPYYLVPKYEGKGADVHDGVSAKDAWRVSFSHVEKDILLKHGSEKTCCEREGQHCCRKDCLKLLKHLLSLLKEKEASFKKFYSYLAKTTLLHACSSRVKDSDWSASSLSRCFLQLLEDFIGHLEKCVLPNFFIPDQNLLVGIDKKKCLLLASCIEEQRDNDFPIFTCWLHNNEE